MKTLGQFLEEAKATYCGRCGTRHVPPSKGGTCPALKEEADGSEPVKVKNVDITKYKGGRLETRWKKEAGNAKIGWHVIAHDPQKGSKKFIHSNRAVAHAHASNFAFGYPIKKEHKRPLQEGTMPTADEPTEHDKKMAQKVRDLLAKEKKPMKEERDNSIRTTKVMHKGQHVATVSTYRGRAGGWVSQAQNPDGSSAHKKYGIGLIDTKKEILKKIKTYHKENQ